MFREAAVGARLSIDVNGVTSFGGVVSEPAKTSLAKTSSTMRWIFSYHN
jgi:hypothetical protein